MKKNYERVRCSIVPCGAVDVICSSDDVGGAWNSSWFNNDQIGNQD